MELQGASGPSQQHPAAPTSSSWARKSTPSKLAPKGGRAGFSGIATAQHTTHKQASHFWVNIQAVAVTNAVNKVQKSLDKVLYIASKQAIWPNLYQLFRPQTTQAALHLFSSLVATWSCKVHLAQANSTQLLPHPNSKATRRDAPHAQNLQKSSGSIPPRLLQNIQQIQRALIARRKTFWQATAAELISPHIALPRNV